MILCGTDFTHPAAAAAEVAGAFALRRGTTLALVHVLEQLGQEEAAARLQREVERLQRLFPALRIETKIESGIPDEVLCELALPAAFEQGGEDAMGTLLIVGALGRRKPSRWPLGSTAERTVQSARVPVVVVRESTPFLSWLREERRLRVLVGVDFSEVCAGALRWAAALATTAPCEVTVAHVTWPSSNRGRSKSRIAPPTPGSSAASETLLRHNLARWIRQRGWAGPLPNLSIRFSSGRRAIALTGCATEERADLLIVGSRFEHAPGRLWQESVSRAALYHAPVSVASVPQPPLGLGTVPAVREPEVDQDEVALVRRLAAHPFLQGVPGTVLRRFASISSEVLFPENTPVFREGEPAHTLYLVERGHVLLELNVPGKGAACLESLRAGDLLGLSWLFPPYRWQLDARAVEETRTLAIDGRCLRDWMNEDPEILRAIAPRLIHQLYQRLERVRMQRLDLYKAEP